jgi:hypothetical protein
VRLVDLETGALRDVDVSPAMADAYAEAFTAHVHALEQTCGRYHLGYLRADAERPFEDVILQAFRQGQFLA